MITAREAKKIAEESDAAFKALLEKAGEKIEEAAKKGVCVLNLSEAGISFNAESQDIINLNLI